MKLRAEQLNKSPEEETHCKNTMSSRTTQQVLKASQKCKEFWRPSPALPLINRSEGHACISKLHNQVKTVQRELLHLLNGKWQRVPHQAQVYKLSLLHSDLRLQGIQPQYSQKRRHDVQEMVLLGKAQLLDAKDFFEIPLVFMVWQRFLHLLFLIHRGSLCNDHKTAERKE